MELDIFIVDAFTNKRFKGNPAAVIPLSDWLSAELMQNIAAENNLSETAFIKKINHKHYEIRWFSPICEIDFCGHATLASAYVLFNNFGLNSAIRFSTLKVGDLTVEQLADGKINMDFPNQCPKPITDIPDALRQGLSHQPIEVLRNRQAYFVVLASASDVRNIEYDSNQLKLLAPYDVVVTATADKSECVDFVSRYFWPANGSDEDPVTGSIYAGLAPYWGNIMDKSHLIAKQASARSGMLYCQLVGERVNVAGDAVQYLQGKVTL